MGKTRVYELAKELNMTNRELVDKLQEMGLSVKSHSSTIEDARVREIRERLQGHKSQAASEAIVRPTVIRRRKKVVDAASAEDDSLSDESVSDEEVETEDRGPSEQDDKVLVQPADEPAPEQGAEVAAGPETLPESGGEDLKAAAAEVEAAAEDAGTKAETDEQPVVRRIKFKTDTPAKILTRPTPPPQPPVEEVRKAEDEAVEPLLLEKEKDEKALRDNDMGEPESVMTGAEVEPEAPAVPETSELKEAEAGESALVEAEPVSAQEKTTTQPEPEPKTVNKKLRRLKKTKDEPAKIISRPVVPVAPRPPVPPTEAAVVTPFQPRPRPEVPRPRPDMPRPGQDIPRPKDGDDVPDHSSEARKAKKKKKTRDEIVPVEPVVEAAPSRKKGSRRKEVIEKDDLYDKGQWDRGGRGRRGSRPVKKQAKTEITVPKAIKRRIKMDEAISVAELAKKMGIKGQELVRKLMQLGVMASINKAVDFDAAALVAAEFGYEVERGAFDEEDFLHTAEVDSADKTHRPPIVTVMGHVDHGKTSLLDAIRKTNVIGGEAGGITQHIGAYHVKLSDGRSITFLDTPGHEAFTSMRARGAQVTDIVILVVAADDGVMLQTREAVNHARAANVPIIVAVNKVDKAEAEPDRIRREMSDLGLVPEAWGGDTIFVDVSAKSGQGVDDLLEMVLLQSDIMELTAVPAGRARGRIIEARLDKGRGPVATLLVQDGVLRQGDPFVCGVYHGKIRAMFNDLGGRVDTAGPSIPLEIQGITGVPHAGDEFFVLEDEKQTKQVSAHRQLKQRESELLKTSKVTLETLFDSIKEGIKELNLVLKADVQGSLEAIADALTKLGNAEIKINIIHSSTGAISETDIMLASASNALVVGFNVRPNAKVQDLADQENIQIRFYDIIYKLIDEIKEAMAGLLEPIQKEKVLGRAEVRNTFGVSKVGTIAGSSVLDGKIIRGAKARLLRNDVVIYDGKISSLKRFKDDAKEVLTGYECGIGLENYNDIKVGDVVEAYIIEEVAATLD